MSIVRIKHGSQFDKSVDWFAHQVVRNHVVRYDNLIGELEAVSVLLFQSVYQVVKKDDLIGE